MCSVILLTSEREVLRATGTLRELGSFNGIAEPAKGLERVDATFAQTAMQEAQEAAMAELTQNGEMSEAAAERLRAALATWNLRPISYRIRPLGPMC